jgi:hypothetical protein
LDFAPELGRIVAALGPTTDQELLEPLDDLHGMCGRTQLELIEATPPLVAVTSLRTR